MSESTPIETVWIDGEFVEAAEATESVLAHGLHYGAGVLEGVRYYDSGMGSVLFHWDDHLDRFYRSARLFDLDIEYDRAELTAAAIELVRAHEFRDGYLRPLAYFGPSFDGPSLHEIEAFPTRVVLMTWPRASRIHDDGIDVMTSSWRRLSSTQVPTTAKLTGPYASNMLARLEARRNGYEDAIMLNSQGEVAEGSTANLVVVDDGDIRTPGPAADILDGITKTAVVELARDLEYHVEDRTRISRGELYDADELFFVGTGAEITPIVSLDGMAIGSGTVGHHTRRIRERFFEVVRRTTDEYDDWFTYA